MKPKFTPAPWAWFGYYLASGDHIILFPGADSIYHYGDLVERPAGGFMKKLDTRGPNARLIAKAPVMFELMQEFVNSNDDKNSPYWKSMMSKILAEIEGES